MRTVGLITEYNPFHNGHLYHLNAAKEAAGARAVVCVMSGNFMQRGEPAIYNKWLRAKTALLCGVDLVIELPVAYAIRGAQSFALGGITLLEKTGIVTDFCCGAETSNLEELRKATILTTEEPAAAKTQIKRQLKQGKQLSAARQAAFGQDDTVRRPNNILAIEYLKALKLLGSPIKPHVIQRIGSDHNEYSLKAKDGCFSAGGSVFENRSLSASGAAIRVFLAQHGLTDRLKDYVPPATWEMVSSQLQRNVRSTDNKLLFPFIQYKLLCSTPQQLEQYTDVAEGLENKIRQAVMTSRDYQQLVQNIKSKRYSWSRIQRILLAIILNYYKADAHEFDSHGGPQYLRVLGFNRRGRQLLKEMNSAASLPLITRPARYMTEDSVLTRMLQLDITSSDIYDLISNRSQPGSFGQDFRQQPVIIDE